MRDDRGKVGLRALAVLIGAVLTVVLVSTVFFKWNLTGPGPLLTQRFSVGEFVSDIPRHLHWMIAFAILTGLMVPFRALQWQRALQRPVPFWERYHLVAIGAFANNAIPGKLGDVIRSFLLSRSQNLPFVQSLGSVAVCKLLEFAALMLLVAASFLGPFGQTMGQFSDKLIPALILCLSLVLVVVLLAHYAESLARALERRHRMPKLQHALVNIGEGLGTARSFRGMALALVFSIGPVLAPALAYGIGLKGLGIHGGLFAGAVVLGAIAFGQTVIGVPAGMGIYYAVTSWAARELGATDQEAAAYAFLTHISTLGTQLLVGAVSIRIRKIRWSELKRRTTLAAEAMRQATEGAGEKHAHA
jgi:hypothetical protein